MLDTIDQKAATAAEAWLQQAVDALTAVDRNAVESLFSAESYWRDVLALTWGLETTLGRKRIGDALCIGAPAAGLSDLKVEIAPLPPRHVVRVGTETIEAFFTFSTNVGRGRGIVRLCADESEDGQYKAWTLLTALEELTGFEERTGRKRPTGESHSRDFRGPNWLDQLNQTRAYADRDPAVIVVGGGHAGLAIAARLSHLGVDTLVVDKEGRIGDNWRLRYHALTLHNQVQVNHMPYMPFPPGWPTYIPKDKLANWFEVYVDALELNFWTSTEFLGGTYDHSEQVWEITLGCADGSKRTMRPQHVVMATGVSGIANRPDISTLEQFAGSVVHSSEYEDGEDWSGKRAIVIGTGNSGHDIAQDLASSGADVTIVQRNPTLIVNIEPSAQLPYSLYEEGPVLDDCDFITLSMPTPLARKAHTSFTRRARELDEALLDGLERIGFRLDFGEDDTGWQFKYLTRGGGYYFNVGCSDMLVAGAIRLCQFDQIDHFSPKGACLKDGETLSADLVVLATGYMPQEYLIKKLFGEKIARRVGPIWGFGDGQELRAMYARTDQPGLWFIAGSLAQCRINSKYLALQIKACEEDLLSPSRAAVIR